MKYREKQSELIDAVQFDGTLGGALELVRALKIEAAKFEVEDLATFSSTPATTALLGVLLLPDASGEYDRVEKGAFLAKTGAQLQIWWQGKDFLDDYEPVPTEDTAESST